MKKVLVVTDSNAMPQKGLSYEETWLGRMVSTHNDYHFIHSCRRGSSTARLAEFDESGYDHPFDVLEYYEPEVVILQIGGTDAAPRLIKKKSFLGYLLTIVHRRIKWQIIELYQKYSTRSIKKADLPMSHVERNFENYFKRANELNVKVIMVMCSRFPSWTAKKSPELRKYWDICNDIMMKHAAKYDNIYPIHPFDENDDIDNLILDDFHPKPEGHEIVFNNINKQFCQL